MYQIFVFDAFLEITIIKLIGLLEMGNNSTKELKTCPIKFSNLVFALEKQIEKSKKELLNIFTKMPFMRILSKLMLNRTRDKGHLMSTTFYVSGSNPLSLEKVFGVAAFLPANHFLCTF